jgi:hypothetical protein
MEPLEVRNLMSSVTGYAPASFFATSGAYDATGHVWVANVLGANGSELDRISNGTNGAIDQTISLGNASPLSLVISPFNGHFFFIDSNTQEIGEVNPGNLSAGVTYHQDTALDPTSVTLLKLTATKDGAIWFTMTVAAPANLTGPFLRTNMVGRLDPSANTFSTVTLNNTDATVNDADESDIQPLGNNSVLVSLAASEDANFPGHNHLATIASSGSGFAVNTYSVDPQNQTNDLLDSAVADGNGNIWMSLVSPTSAPTPFIGGFDQIVEVQQPVIPPGTQISNGTLIQVASAQIPSPDSNPIQANSLQLDGNGRLWFADGFGNHAGYVDTTQPLTSQAFTVFTIPNDPNVGATTSLGWTIASKDPSINDVWYVNTGTGDTLIDVTADAPVTGGTGSGTGSGQIQFSGAAADQSAQEGVALNNILLATFTAPTGTYTATVSWGDNTTTAASVVDLGNNQFAVMVNSKTFATQGTYNGTVTVLNSDTSVEGTLTFTSKISDTPLTITSFNATPLILRLAVVTMTFTDDASSQASWFTATVNWGDNTSSKGLVVKISPGQYVVISLHQYKKKGTYHVTASVTTSELDAAYNPLNSTVASALVTV